MTRVSLVLLQALPLFLRLFTVRTYLRHLCSSAVEFFIRVHSRFNPLSYLCKSASICGSFLTDFGIRGSIFVL
jgi:hypothetical protein